MKIANDNADAEVNFRFAARDDVAGVVALLADDELGAGREAVDDQAMAGYLAAFDAMQAQGGNKYLLAVGKGGDLLGCVQITLIPGLSRAGMTRAQLEGVRVAASARGQGMGGLLLAEAHAIAAAEGCALVQLTTDRRRDDALRFYEQLGYDNSHNGMKLPLSPDT